MRPLCFHNRNWTAPTKVRLIYGPELNLDSRRVAPDGEKVGCLPTPAFLVVNEKGKVAEG
jgi:hypothetical protein